MGSKHAKHAQEYYSPFFCLNSKPNAKVNKKSFDQKTKHFNTESVTKIIKNRALRKHFNLCNIITKDKIEKLILSENFQFLFILHSKCIIDIYSREDQNILYTLFEDEVIRFMILFDQKNAVYYVTDQNVFRWDYQENSVVDIVNYRFNSINTISASPDFSYIAIGECYGEIILINCDSINSYVILESHSSCVIEIAFTQDSQYFISAGGDHELHFDCSIRVWNAEKQSLIVILAGHPITVYSLKIHDSGKFFLSLSRDCTIRLWDLEKVISNSSETECQGKYLSSNKKHFDNNSKIHRKMLSTLNKYPERNPPIIDLNYKFVANYVMHVLKNYKENTEINRLKFSFDLFSKQSLPIAAYAFFLENSIVLLNPLDMKFVFFDMFGEVVQKTIELLSGPHTIINALHGKVAYLDEELNMYVQNLIDQENKVIAFPVNNLEFLDVKLRNSKFLLSFYFDFTVCKYILTIWDLKKIVFHGSLIIDYYMPKLVSISENAELLFLYAFKKPIIIMDIARKTILHKVSIKNQLMNSGFSDDSKYIFAIMEKDTKHHISVWRTRGTKKKLKFVKSQFDQQFIIKLKDDLYLGESFANEVVVVSNKNLNKKQKQLWGCKKSCKYGVLAGKNSYFIYRLSKAAMMILNNN